MAGKHAWIFVSGHYLFQEANRFPREKLKSVKENCELSGTDIDAQGQICEHIFTPNGGYILCSLSFKYFLQCVWF